MFAERPRGQKCAELTPKYVYYDEKTSLLKQTPLFPPKGGGLKSHKFCKLCGLFSPSGASAEGGPDVAGAEGPNLVGAAPTTTIHSGTQ